MVRKNDLPACPVAVTVSLIGSKWKLLILRDLTAKVCRFNELIWRQLHVKIITNAYSVNIKINK